MNRVLQLFLGVILQAISPHVWDQLVSLVQSAARTAGETENKIDDVVVKALSTILGIEIPQGVLEIEDLDGILKLLDTALEAVSPQLLGYLHEAIRLFADYAMRTDNDIDDMLANFLVKMFKVPEHA